MGGDQVILDLRARLRGLGEEVDMHLIRPAFRPLMAEMSEIEARRLVAGLAKGERGPGPVVVAVNKNVVGAWQGRAADEAIDTVQITPS